MVDNARIHDGTRPATLRVAGGSVALDVSLVDAAGNQVTSFGGGTQYAEGTTSAAATGNVLLGKKAADTIASLLLNASKHLVVDIGTDSVGIGGGTQYTEGTATSTSVVTALGGKQSGGTISALQLDASKNALVALGSAIPAGTNIIGKVQISDATLTAANITQVKGSAIDTNSGNKSDATLRTVIATDQPQLTLPLNVTVNSMTALPAGTNVIGKVVISEATSTAVTNAGTFAVQVSSALPAGSNTIGNVGMVPLTAGGLSVFRDLDLDETGELLKNAAGQLYGGIIHNANSTTTLFVKFYDMASTATSSATPLMTVPVPPETILPLGIFSGVPFATGIALRASTGKADNDAGSVTTNDLTVNILYK